MAARAAFAALVGTSLAALAPGAAPSEPPESVLRFARDGVLVKRIERADLVEQCSVTRVEVDDPYYGRRKAFWACPLREVLALGFGANWNADPQQSYFLRALDGYTKPATGERLADPGGQLAFADAGLGSADAPQWEPIDRRQVDPGPFYLVWTGPGQNDIHRYPWPYQLVKIEIAAFESEYPHTLPGEAPPGSPAHTGFGIFRRECIACHAINGEGGVIGPELNVPRSIVEYRPAEQIKAYIRDPGAFRYTSMPPHRHLSESQLDALVAYFRAMSQRKFDPHVPPGP